MIAGPEAGRSAHISKWTCRGDRAPSIWAGGYLTSTSALELEELPRSLLVIGGGFVGAELAQMIGTTRSRVSSFMNKFRKLGFIDYNGGIVINRSLLNVVLLNHPETAD